MSYCKNIDVDLGEHQKISELPISKTCQVKNLFEISYGLVASDGHDKPFCTKAITVIDNIKKVLGDTDNR